MELYIWKKNILTQYKDGMVAVMATSVEQARELAKTAVWEGYFKDMWIEGETEPDDWPWCDYLKFQKALEQEPTIYTEPTAVYITGGE